MYTSSSYVCCCMRFLVSIFSDFPSAVLYMQLLFYKEGTAVYSAKKQVVWRLAPGYFLLLLTAPLAPVDTHSSAYRVRE